MAFGERSEPFDVNSMRFRPYWIFLRVHKNKSISRDDCNNYLEDSAEFLIQDCVVFAVQQFNQRNEKGDEIPSEQIWDSSFGHGIFLVWFIR